MGVKRLKKYLVENNHTRTTNLKDVADEWKAVGGNNVLLVDTSSILHYVVNYNEVLCCGGEYPAVEERFLEIIKAFEALSIELVFCVDGSIVDGKLDSWKRRRIDRMSSYIHYFEKIHIRKVGGFAEAQIFPILAPSVAKETAKSHCQIIDTDGDPDIFMAQYIREHKCLGIVTEDTDFVVFDGIPHVFISKDIIKNICFSDGNGAPFDPNFLEVTEYVRSQFVDSIHLQLEAFPVFATLAGNDFIDCSYTVEYFKRKFGNTSLQTNVFHLANIANDIYRQSGGNVEAAALNLANEIFQSTDYKDIMVDSLKSYDLNNNDTEQPVPFHPNYKEWYHLIEQIWTSSPHRPDPGVMRILICQTYEQSERFEYERNPCGNVTTDFRRRMYSVLLHEKSDKMEFVEELVATSPSCFQTRYLIGTVKVEVDHPGLWNLFYGGEEYDEARWKIVWWVICPQKPTHLSRTPVNFDKFQNLINLPDELKLIGMSVFYLFTVIQEITEEEASVLMLMASIVALYTPHMLHEFSMVKEITSRRAVCVATLYQQTYIYAKSIAVKICHLNFRFKTSKCYSGHLFHWLFKFQENIRQLQSKIPSEVWDKFHLLETALKESA